MAHLMITMISLKKELLRKELLRLKKISQRLLKTACANKHNFLLLFDYIFVKLMIRKFKLKTDFFEIECIVYSKFDFKTMSQRHLILHK